MLSKRSFFNGTLFRKSLTRYWPLWAAPSFVGALFPLAMLTQLLRRGVDAVGEPLVVTEAYYTVVARAVPIISLVYAILVAVAVWSYLFHARSVGMMHTLPIRREGLFVTGVLSGMAMMLIPYVITGAICIVVFGCFGIFDPVGILLTILAIIGESLFYFASATCVAFVTGNLFAMPVLYFIFHFLAVALDALVCLFAQGFLFGVSGDYSGAVEWLSPTVYLINHLQIRTDYTERFIPYQTGTTGGWQRVLSEVRLENGWLIAVYALLGLALLGAAWLLYSRRRSESAGDVVAVQWMKPVFRWGVTVCSAMLGGLALYEIFWRGYQYGKYYEILPMVVCMLIAGAIGYYAAGMLLAKSLRVFRGSLKGLATVAMLSAAVCCVMEFDLLGVEKRVPSIREVKEVTFYAAGNNYTFSSGEEDELLERVRAVHLAIAQDAEYAAKAYDERGIAKEHATTTVRFEYRLKNGATVYRRYSLALYPDRITDPATYDFALDRLVNSGEMKSKRIHDDNSGFAVVSGNLYVETVHENFNLSNREARAIWEAVCADAKAGAWGNYDWFDTHDGTEYAMSLSLEFAKKNVDGNGVNYTEYDYLNISVYPNMTHTANVLLALDLVKAEDLITSVQLYPERYKGTGAQKELMDKYGIAYEDLYDLTGYDPYSAPTVQDIIAGAVTESSVGIIGGADGPTAIIVGN